MCLAAMLSSNRSFLDSNQDCVLNSETFLFNTLNDMKYYLFALGCLGDRSQDCSAAATDHAFAAAWDARNAICLCRLNDNRSERKDEGNKMH